MIWIDVTCQQLKVATKHPALTMIFDNNIIFLLDAIIALFSKKYLYKSLHLERFYVIFFIYLA